MLHCSRTNPQQLISSSRSSSLLLCFEYLLNVDFSITSRSPKPTAQCGSQTYSDRAIMSNYHDATFLLFRRQDMRSDGSSSRYRKRIPNCLCTEWRTRCMCRLVIRRRKSLYKAHHGAHLRPTLDPESQTRIASLRLRCHIRRTSTRYMENYCQGFW